MEKAYYIGSIRYIYPYMHHLKPRFSVNKLPQVVEFDCSM